MKIISAGIQTKNSPALQQHSWLHWCVTLFKVMVSQWNTIQQVQFERQMNWFKGLSDAQTVCKTNCEVTATLRCFTLALPLRWWIGSIQMNKRAALYLRSTVPRGHDSWWTVHNLVVPTCHMLHNTAARVVNHFKWSAGGSWGGRYNCVSWLSNSSRWWRRCG